MDITKKLKFQAYSSTIRSQMDAGTDVGYGRVSAITSTTMPDVEGQAPTIVRRLKIQSDYAIGCLATDCRGGRGIRQGKILAGKILTLRKVAKFYAREILVQFHSLPQLQALCFWRRARRDYERI